MYRKIVKSVLMIPSVEKRIKSFYGLDAEIAKNRDRYRVLRDRVYAFLINGNGWVFSQQKSGTHKFENVLAFYRAAKCGYGEFDFSEKSRFGVFEFIGKDLDLDAVRRYRMYASAQRSPYNNADVAFFETHRYISARPKILILLSRNVLDYSVSYYFYGYKNRANMAHLSVDQVLGEIVDYYIDCHLGQVKAAQNADSVYAVYYEDMMDNDFTAYSRVLREIDCEYSEDALRVAIEQASPEKLVAYERKEGRPLTHNNSFTASHFIRSGKVGEGREFFTAQQIEYIEKKCADAGVPTNGRFTL